MSNEYTSDVVESVLSKLNGVRRTGSGWQARCPCRNDDDNPSLSIGQGRDGRVLFNCHRGNGCNVEQICESLNIKVAELYPSSSPQTYDSRNAMKPVASKAPAARPVVPQEKRKLELVATYNYRDEAGKLLFQKQRFIDEDGKKTFKQRRPSTDGSGSWVYSLDGVDKVLYRLPEVLKARRQGDTIWLVEGEKDADTLVDLGQCSTTPPNGAGKWLDIHTNALAGANVFIIADNDSAGVSHARMVARTLIRAGCTVSTFIPPAGYKDVTDLIEAGMTLDALVDLSLTDEVQESNEEPAQEPDKEQSAEQPADEPEDDGQSGVAALSEQIGSILGRENMPLESRLLRVKMLVSQFGSHEEHYDRGTLVNWQKFLNEKVDDSYDWVIPNFIERGERIMVVAAEGVGKTMLARQVAICSAAGIHPFTKSRIKPIRTLTIDLENPARIIRRTSESIMGAAVRFGYSQNVDAHLLIKPAGVDLLRPSDRALIEEVVEKIRPDLLLIGPVYKAFLDPGGRTSEAVAVEVARYFDMLRDTYNCALWLEHHAPLGSSSSTRDLRPFGSAVWSRWPEFGVALHIDPTAVGEYMYDVKHFRGARDERQFPIKMKRGKVFPFDVVEFNKFV